MRLLEWLFLLAFIPALLLPFIPQTWRRRSLIIAALLPTLVGGMHLLAEGWRIQMVPLYGLALLILVTRLFTLSRPETRVRRGRGLLLSATTALIVVGCGVVSGWLLPVVTLPEPTGPYLVGINDRELVDEARQRRLMVSVWYPAAQGGTSASLTHYPDEVATALGNLSGLPGIGLQHLRYFALNASENAPLAADNESFPVLVFSHGLVGLRLQNSSTLQELASWGYVVVAIDHTDAAAVTVFPDGEARFYNLEAFGIAPNVEPDISIVNDRVFPVWVADQRFVYDTLETWAVSDSLFAGRLDLTHIGSFGHSFGGATALEVCRVDPRCRAAVNMDGGLYGDITTEAAVTPLLLMSSSESSQYADTVEDWSNLITNANAPAYWLELPASTHFSFTITQLLSPLLVPDGFDARNGLYIVDKYLRAFFDRHVRDEETIPFGPSLENSEVRWLSDPQ